MRLKTLMLVALGVVVLASSGCFTLRGFNWSPSQGTSGKVVTARVTVAPALLPGPPGPGTSHTDVPFTMIGFTDSTNLKLAQGSVWDPKGRFNGPKELFRDQSLANYVLSSGRCDPTDLGANQVPLALMADNWTAVRVAAPVNDGGKVARTTLENIRFRVNPAAQRSVVNVWFLTAAWADDGDGAPDDDDTLGCGGSTVAALPLKPKN